MPKEQYEIMHMDRKVARIDESGHCKIYFFKIIHDILFLQFNDIGIPSVPYSLSSNTVPCVVSGIPESLFLPVHTSSFPKIASARQI